MSDSTTQPVKATKTNVMAIVALIAGISFIPTLGVIFGHIALSQIKMTKENGRGLAIAGLVLGYVVVGFWAIIILFIVAVNSINGSLYN